MYYVCCHCRVCKRTENSFRDASIALELYFDYSLIIPSPFAKLLAVTLSSVLRYLATREATLGLRICLCDNQQIQSERPFAASNLVPSRGDSNTLVISGQHISQRMRAHANTSTAASLLVVTCVLASVVCLADGRAARRRQDGRGEPAQFKLELEHEEEDWRAKYLGASARLENNECGRPDELDEGVANDEGLWAPFSFWLASSPFVKSFRLIDSGAASCAPLFTVFRGVPSIGARGKGACPPPAIDGGTGRGHSH